MTANPRNRVRYIFTYGTLMACCQGRQGASERSRMNAEALLVGPGAIRGRVYDAGACPAATRNDAGPRDRVHGEIWQLPADSTDLLAVLDTYEGCGKDSPRPFPYVRRRIRVRTSDGRRVTAWMYQWARTTRGLPFLASGLWRETRADRQPIAACTIDALAAVRHGPDLA